MTKELWKDFFKIGCIAAGGGPLIIAVIYAILGANGTLTSLTIQEAVLGILTSLLLAFIAGGISVIYRIETLPLLWATLLHAFILYLDYLIIYWVNGWIQHSAKVVLIFTGCFIAGYFLIWLCIYHSIRHSARNLNRRLRA